LFLDHFKIEFLNQVLSDTTDIQILRSKSELISNFGSGYMSPSLPIEGELSELHFISESLDEPDTAFIQQQLKHATSVNLDTLSTYGFQIFDLKGKSKLNHSYKSIVEYADSINMITDNYSFLKFTIPIFNKNQNLAYMRFQRGSSGEAIILEKIEDHWIRKIKLYEWME